MRIKLVDWWSEYFDHFVLLDCSPKRDKKTWNIVVIEGADWLDENYPLIKGDRSLARTDNASLAWYAYDWGYSDVHASEGVIVFFFKDPSVAAHFKLANS